MVVSLVLETLGSIIDLLIAIDFNLYIDVISFALFILLLLLCLTVKATENLMKFSIRK